MFAPATRFNGSASPHRVFEARFHDLADFKRIKATVPGATINDVALAYVGGALRRYLEGHDELPDETLVAACPASIRDSSEKGAAATGSSADCSRWKRLSPTRTNGSHRSSPNRPRSATTPILRADSRLMELVGLVPTTLLGLTVKAATAMPFSRPHDRQHHGEQRARPDRTDLLHRRPPRPRHRPGSL